MTVAFKDSNDLQKIDRIFRQQSIRIFKTAQNIFVGIRLTRDHDEILEGVLNEY